MIARTTYLLMTTLVVVVLLESVFGIHIGLVRWIVQGFARFGDAFAIG